MNRAIDVLMPVFNNEATIESAVESILNQSFRDFRLIVVNDGSTDRTGELLGRHVRRDDRILVITTENRGIVQALNTGLQQCSAEFVARHDGDDIAFSTRLEKQLQYLTEFQDCIAVSNNVWHIDADGVRIGATHGPSEAKSALDAVPAGEPHLIHPFLMTRLASVQQIGGYRHVLHAEDADLYLRLEPLGRLHVLQERLGEYRIHSGSITSGSAHNVRIGATYSQLAALSARRRARGWKDLEFTSELAQQVKTARSLARMVQIASQALDANERAYLEVATAAKMLQSRVFRRFRFSWKDVRTIARFLVRHHSLIPRGDKLRMLVTPFWYFYRPRAYLSALLKFIAGNDDPPKHRAL